MTRKLIFILFALMTAPLFAQTNVAPLDLTTQLVLVTTKSWDAVPGVMRRFARADAQSPWKQIGVEIPVVVGRSGLGWGKGINPSANLPGPIKHEGDGKSPAGIFRLSSAFGLAEVDKVNFIKLPYRQLTNGVECVDDVKSARYNSITVRGQPSSPGWDSSEKMSEITNGYRLGIFIDHNVNPSEPGGGSCVFIHIWDNAQTGTSGCTAMAPANLESLLSWLDPAAKPVLVQLTESDYHQLQQIWQLP